MMPLPHRITVKRSVSTFNATTGAEVAGTATTVYEHVKALISPSSTGVMYGPFGPHENQEDLIFLDSVDEVGDAYQIRVRDWLIDEDTDDVWIAIAPGNTFQNPVGFASGVKKADHIEVKVTRADLEASQL